LCKVPPSARPSMVVIFLPSAALTGSEQERTAPPSTCTVHAPHWAMPQPYFVPVSPICSRMTHSRGVLGSTSMEWDCPLMTSRTICRLLLQIRGRALLGEEQLSAAA